MTLVSCIKKLTQIERFRQKSITENSQGSNNSPFKTDPKQKNTLHNSNHNFSSSFR